MCSEDEEMGVRVGAANSLPPTALDGVLYLLFDVPGGGPSASKHQERERENTQPSASVLSKTNCHG